MIVLNRDLESLPNGDPRIYWTPKEKWRGFRGASGFNIVADVLNSRVVGDSSQQAQLRWYMQWSVDGLTWRDFDGFPTSAATISDGTHIEETFFPSDVEVDAPLVRFGVQVASSGSNLAISRLTIVAMPFR